MKVILFILVLAAAGWFLYGRSRNQAPAAAARPPNAVERYGQSLADDVKKADAVRDKANAAIKQAEDARKALPQND